MTLCPSRSATASHLTLKVQPSPFQVLLGGAVACGLALAFFSLVWLGQERLFKEFPILAVPFLLTMVLGPTFLFISVRRMTELGVRKRLVLAALLSVAAITLVTGTFLLSLQHLAVPRPVP